MEVLAAKMQEEAAMAALHTTVIIIAVAAAAMFFLAWRKFGKGEMSNCVRWVTLGTIAIAFASGLENLDILFPGSAAYAGYAVHALEIIGFCCLGFAAWEIYRFSSKIG
ncbi:MAG: hypothetical protein WC792_00015 [Candidatus Micrarchaeia archaeon]|jgi:hypothetical protein